MILEDLHTHTIHCDGKNTVEEMVEAAIEKGLKTIGFSGHVYGDYCLDYCMTPEITLEYERAVCNAQEKYDGKIRILRGIEADPYTSYPLDGFEYIIGSVHEIYVGGKFLSIDHSPEIFDQEVKEFLGGDFYKACKMYYEAVTKCVKKIKPDIIGHFDLITKFNEVGSFFDENHPRYIAAWKKALDEIIPLGIPFEINSGAISRNWKTIPYPALNILKYIAENGGKVILTGDTHSKENLCYKFDEMEALARKAGFKSFCTADDILK